MLCKPETSYYFSYCLFCLQLTSIHIVACKLKLPTVDVCCCVFSIRKNASVFSRIILISPRPTNVLTLVFTQSGSHVVGKQKNVIGLNFSVEVIGIRICAYFSCTRDDPQRFAIISKRNVCAPIAADVKELACRLVVEEEHLAHFFGVVAVCCQMAVDVGAILTCEVFHARNGLLLLCERVHGNGSHSDHSDSLSYACALQSAHYRIQDFGNLFHFDVKFSFIDSLVIQSFVLLS